MKSQENNLKKAFVLAGLTEEEAEVKASSLAVNVASGLKRGVPNKCLRCRNPMVDVELIGGRHAKYCRNCRIALPIPFE